MPQSNPILELTGRLVGVPGFINHAILAIVIHLLSLSLSLSGARTHLLALSLLRLA